MIKKIYEESEKKMEEVKQSLEKRYSNIRGGRAHIELVADIKVNCYGSRTPINRLSNISVPEPRLIIIEPWDKSIIKNIEKAILTSNLGVNPTNDGNIIRIALPPLTEERRKEIAKVINQWGEETKIFIRNIRREAREKIEELEKKKEISEDEKKRGQKEIQTLTDNFVEEITKIQEKKAQEIQQI